MDDLLTSRSKACCACLQTLPAAFKRAKDDLDWLDKKNFVNLKRLEDQSQQWGPESLGSAACAAGISPEHALMVYQVFPSSLTPITFILPNHPSCLSNGPTSSSAFAFSSSMTEGY